jgi:hypothetical protein
MAIRKPISSTVDDRPNENRASPARRSAVDPSQKRSMSLYHSKERKQVYLNDMSDAMLNRAVESYWDRVWDRMTEDTPFDKASDSEIRSFVYDNFEDEIAELMETFGDTEEEAVDWFIKHHDDEIAERYNEHWQAEYGGGYYDD